jgi:hypothetical protein
VAQLGARFHGMEEVDGSNPSRSTKTFQTHTASPTSRHVACGVPLLMHGHRVDLAHCAGLGHRIQAVKRIGQCGHPFSRLLFAGDDNHLFLYKDDAHRAGGSVPDGHLHRKGLMHLKILKILKNRPPWYSICVLPEFERTTGPQSEKASIDVEMCAVRTTA